MDGKGGSSGVPESVRKKFQKCQLGDFVRVKQGYTFNPKYQGITEGRWAYAKVSDMERFGSPKWLRFTKNYVSDDVLREIKATPFPAGTVVFPRVGAALRTNKKRILPEPALVDDNLMTVVVTDTSACFPEFLYYWFESINIEQFANDGALPSINGKNLLSGWINLPPLEEQRKIANILSTWDEAIEQQTRLFELKRERKRGLMQQLLTGKVRFKEFEGLEWEHVTIGEIASLTAGGTPSTSIPSYWGGTIPWMSSGDIHKGRVYEVIGRITREGLDNSSTKFIPESSVLVALAGQGKTRGSVAINKIKLCTNQSIAAIMLNPSKAFYEYIFYNMQSRYVELRALSAGDGGRGGLNLAILRSIPVNLPPLSEQQKIATVLSTADTELETLQTQLSALRLQKRGLMQQLLTGKTRVKLDDPVTAQ